MKGSILQANILNSNILNIPAKISLKNYLSYAGKSLKNYYNL